MNYMYFVIVVVVTVLISLVLVSMYFMQGVTIENIRISNTSADFMVPNFPDSRVVHNSEIGQIAYEGWPEGAVGKTGFYINYEVWNEGSATHPPEKRFVLNETTGFYEAYFYLTDHDEVRKVLFIEMKDMGSAYKNRLVSGVILYSYSSVLHTYVPGRLVTLIGGYFREGHI